MHSACHFVSYPLYPKMPAHIGFNDPGTQRAADSGKMSEVIL